MKKYKFYAGLPHPFGGVNDMGTYECANEKEAEEILWDMMVECYERYAGMYGILSWEDCAEDYRKENDIDEDTELVPSDIDFINMIYDDAISGRVSGYFEEVE